MGCCSMAARLGTIISPFIIYLGQVYKALPYIIMGGLAISGAFLCIFLPERFGKPLPETLEEIPPVCGRRRRKRANTEKEEYEEKSYEFTETKQTMF